MESSNHKVVRGFLSQSERTQILDFVNEINAQVILNDHHLKYLIGKINGNSYMYDISRTDLTGKITRYQSGGTVMDQKLPAIFDNLIDRISQTINIPTDHCFLQIVDMDKGGVIDRHYDTATQGFINYKCNVSVLSENYDFCVDGETVNVNEGDMYCFEASLYKHWTPNPFHSRRILLSFGFMIPYDKLGRTEDDPRIRLSNRIERYFQR